MNPIEFVSAGAGSGKTYRLTTILSEALASGSARPSGVVAMTFTLKAAAELRQRARKALLGQGRLDLSTAIGQSRIGTVNAVCNQLLQRHCFELGHSPDQTVLSDAQCKQMLRKAVEEVLDPAERDKLVWHGDRFEFERKEWDKPVQNIVDAARSNGINAEALRAMGPANADALLQNWPAPHGIGTDLTARLAQALNTTTEAIEQNVAETRATGKEPQQNTQKALAKLRDARRDFTQGTWTWAQWVSLAKLDAGAKLRAFVQPVQDAAAAHEHHPDFHGEVRQYLALVFDLAALALAGYEEAKREAGAQDFTDQEMLFLRALHNSEVVREALAEELDLVLVDEFQDTSPIQLAVFVELAKLAKRSVWVGDPKQAIYGFRGTDSRLIAAVLDAIPSWGGALGEPLSSSRRSVPSLVKLVNQAFVPAFPRLKREEIALSSVRTEHPSQPSLITWSLDTSNIDQDFQALGPALSELLTSGLQVQDVMTEEWRPLKAGDIAVLCRTNKQIPLVASALYRWGLPCVSTRPGLLATPEARLVVACLRRMHDPRDTVATAFIVSLSDSVPPEMWLDDRLRHLQAGGAAAAWKAQGADAHTLVARLEALRGRLAALTPFEALCLAKAESDVWRAAAHWSLNPTEAAGRAANVEALVRMGAAYEDECRSSKRPATVAGLLQWLAGQAAAGSDARAMPTGDAVEVSTQHSAKGLEWPVVILTGLDNDARSDVWSVRTRTDGEFDAQDPLRGRFVHYWPRPFGPLRLPDVVRRAQDCPLGLEMLEQATEEHRRLLYVSCTRARDIMVLVHRSEGGTAWLDAIGASQLFFAGDGDIQLDDGTVARRARRPWTLPEIAAQPPAPVAVERRWLVPRPRQEHPPLWLRPSAAADGAYRTEAVEDVGTRIALKTRVDMTSLGSAVHNSIACYVASGGTATKEDIAAVLARWRIGAAVEPEPVLAQAQALLSWVQSKWPGAKVWTEVPVEVMLKSGRIVKGQIDLLIEVTEGWVLVDHKADPRSAAADGDRLAQAHGAQLDAYAEAVLEGTGRAVVERWLFLPVAAQGVKVGAGTASIAVLTEAVGASGNAAGGPLDNGS